jgi:nucleotide-binding universal stress UspA family protein
MTIRTILAAVSGGAATEGALEAAFRLARRLDAHVEAFHARVDERQALTLYGDGLAAPMSGELLERIVQETATTAAHARSLFDAAVARHGLPIRSAPPAAANPPVFEASASWHEETGYGPDLVAQHGRLFDLIVLGRSERVVDQPYSDAIEDAVMQSGRPVLLAPAKPAAALGETIAVGWNGSVEAVHAVAAGLPLLATAKDIKIITIAETDEGAGAQVVGYLAWHQIPAAARLVLPVKGVGAGEQLLASARDDGADLLVMGGYGKTPWREFLFGGATRQVVGTSLLPILLVH